MKTCKEKLYKNYAIRKIPIMPYQKKVLLLKCAENSLITNKSLSALARIEIENGMAEFHLSIINLPLSLYTDFYALVIDQSKKVFEFELGARPNSFAGLFNDVPIIEKGLAVGLYVIKDNLPQVLAFATDNIDGFCLADFKRLVAEKCLAKFKENIKNREENEQMIIQEYNDEAVATENYYELDKEIKQKLCSIKENQNENLWTENELSNRQSQEKTQERFNFIDGAQNETGACVCKEHQKLNTFFDQVKNELEDLFLRFPTEECLEKCFNDSKWVRINYSSDKYYVVGLIKEFGKEKYVCYGVPAVYSKTAPKELAGYCSFVPKSIFNTFGEGYWIMFQDAVSGKCVHLE